LNKVTVFNRMNHFVKISRGAGMAWENYDLWPGYERCSIEKFPKAPTFNRSLPLQSAARQTPFVKIQACLFSVSVNLEFVRNACSSSVLCVLHTWPWERRVTDKCLSRIWGFHGGECEDGCLLGCSTDRSDDGGSKDLWNVGTTLPDYTVLQPRRQPSSDKCLLVGDHFLKLQAM
jgi:hypothetical protein